MAAGVAARQQVEQLSTFNQAVTLESRTADAGPDTIGIATCEGEIDQAIAGKVRVDGNIKQAPLTVLCDLWQAGDWLGVQDPIGEQSQFAGAFCDQDAAVRQEGHTPWMLQPFGQRNNPEPVRGLIRDTLPVAGDDWGSEHQEDENPES